VLSTLWLQRTELAIQTNVWAKVPRFEFRLWLDIMIIIIITIMIMIIIMMIIIITFLQHNIIEKIEERRLRWFGLFEEDEK